MPEPRDLEVDRDSDEILSEAQLSPRVRIGWLEEQKVAAREYERNGRPLA